MATNLPNTIVWLCQVLLSLCKRYYVDSLVVFDEYARDEQRFDSYLDLLIAFDEIPSQLRFIELKNCLPDSLGILVDLVMRNALELVLVCPILEEAMLV